jgi:hypothetical protein
MNQLGLKRYAIVEDNLCQCKESRHCPYIGNKRYCSVCGKEVKDYTY